MKVGIRPVDADNGGFRLILGLIGISNGGTKGFLFVLSDIKTNDRVDKENVILSKGRQDVSNVGRSGVVIVFSPVGENIKEALKIFARIEVNNLKVCQKERNILRT